MMFQITTDGQIVRLTDGAVIPDDPANGDYQVYQQWVSEGNTPSVLDRQQAIAFVEQQINQYRYSRETQGVPWGEYIVQTRQEDIGRLQAEVLAVQIGDRQDNEIWRMAENINVPMTNAELVQMASAVRAHVKQCFGLAWYHKAQIDALQDVEAILTYDYKTGW